ncbi:hypothetical protein LTR37_015711 [Vermiconidia calcicola]|uniref:Uncharacterized protein n=1 Tax=Vermiconidia calcicola TaxID=1690605 RepID=A0ACC3MPV8_9PEZI|nr:hypothetical protein LTR37_015711 [Vermiconidia calcicola]
MSIAQDYTGTEETSHRACAHCRSQKVRCIIDDDSPEVCQRCARSGKPCIFTPLQKRKQRKRTDTRVAELEREMRAMRSLLKSKERTPQQRETILSASAPRPAGLWFEENTVHASHRDIGSNPTQVKDDGSALKQTSGQTQFSGRSQLWPTRFANRPPEDSKDVVASARQLFETYRKDLFPHYPVVVVPDSTSADDLRQTKPTLFLAIIAAAAAKDNPELSALLDKEVLHAYATKSVVHSEKSVELIQSLLLSAIWYHPPSKFGQLKYYEYIHMAATMAMDIGIGSRPVSHRNRFGTNTSNRESRIANLHHLEDATNPDLSMTPRSQGQSPDTANIESRRTFLACYLVCCGVSMSLRRPQMLRISSYVRECLEYLGRSPNAAPSDRSLVAWVKLTIIGEEISSALSYDDPGGIATLADLKTQLMLKEFERKLSDWFTSTPETDMNDSLTTIYYSIRLYLHEVALHVDHSPEDFTAPFQMGPIHQFDGNGEQIPTKVLAESVAECITSSHSLLSTFLGMDAEKARALPVFSYVRISYAAFFLAKLCLSAAHRGSRIGKVLDRSSLKVDCYMDRAILHTRAIVGSARCRVPAIFLALLFKLRQWCMNPAMIEQPEDMFDGAMSHVGKQATPVSVNDTQASNARYIEGPRVVEHISSDESSPQTSVDGQNGTYESMADYANRTTASLAPNIAPQSRKVDTSRRESGHDVPPAVPDLPSTFPSAALNIDMTQPHSFLDLNNQMELDQNFFQFFDDMNGFSNGGLTGLEDWSSFPADLMGSSDNLNWQAAATIDGGAAL